MKVIVVTTSNSTGNIVKGALQQANVKDFEFQALPDTSDIAQHLTDKSIVFIDWNVDNVSLCAGFVKDAAGTEDNPVPVILLCTKQDAGTTFPGMKAGAKGIVHKPIQPEQLVKAMATVFKNTQSKKTTINVEFINPFIEATKTVFSTMVGINVERKKLFLKEDHQMLGDISGVMGLSGAASGSVVISLPNRLALRMVGKMLGEAPAEEVNNDTCDAIGEIINMISGQAKASLTKTKYHFQISIPTVVRGPKHEVTHKQGTPNIVIMFQSDEDEFALQVCLSPNDEED